MSVHILDNTKYTILKATTCVRCIIRSTAIRLGGTRMHESYERPEKKETVHLIDISYDPYGVVPV